MNTRTFETLPKFPVSSITRELRNRGWNYLAANFSSKYSADHTMTQTEIFNDILTGMENARPYVSDGLAFGMVTMATSVAKNVVESSWLERVEA